MKKIVHLSDLHFGTENKPLIDILIKDIQKLIPDLIVISGDFTQRARKKQFIKARHFLNSLQFPTIKVPGNHDLPLVNLIGRFANPYKSYKKYISSQLETDYVDKEMMLLAINSSTPLRAKNGYINRLQLAKIKEFFNSDCEQRIKILVLHHNMLRANQYKHNIIANSEEIINLLAECGVNIVLSGHLHLAHMEELVFPQNDNHSIFMITAGTAISTRIRAENNSYNYIELEPDHFRLQIRLYSDHCFRPVSTKSFFY